MQLIYDTWLQPISGIPMYKFAAKLRLLKEKIKVWNKEVFGNIHHGVKIAEDLVSQMEIAFYASPSKAN